MRIPRSVWIGLALLPVLAFLALLAWGVTRNNVNPGGLSVFSSSGEVSFKPRQSSPFTLSTFDGGRFESTALRGKVVMVDFWASWCPPCRAEAATLEKVWNAYRDRGVAFVGVDIWDQDDRAREFIQRHGTTYTVGKDPRGQLAVEFGVTGIPEKFFIGPDGVILRKFVGPMDEARLSRILDELLAPTKVNPQ